MKKALIICHLLLLSRVFSQQNGAFIDELQVFTGFNNVAWGNTLYNTKAIAEQVYPQAKDHNWELSYPVSDNFSEWGFPYLRMPSFYINAIAGHKLSIPHLYWRFGVNYIYSNTLHKNFNGYGTLDHSWAFNDSGYITGYKQSREFLDHSFAILTSKLSVENALYIRSSHPGSRRSVYFGISTQVGIARSRYNYSYNHNSSEYDIDSSGFEQETSSYSYEFQASDKGKAGAYASLNGLFGYDRRLGKRKPGLRTVHLFAEFKPGYCVFYAPELKSWKTAYNGFWSLVGVRYTFENEEIEPVREK